MEESDVLSAQAFAEKVKARYPEYKDVDNLVLAKKMVEKYPEYSSKVSFEHGTLPLTKDVGNTFGVPDFNESTIMADGSQTKPISELNNKLNPPEPKIPATPKLENSVSGNFYDGLKMAAGTLLRSPSALDDAALVSLKSFMPEGVNLEMVKTIIKNANPSLSFSDKLGKIGAEMIKSANEAGEQRTEGIKYKGSAWDALKNGEVRLAGEYAAKGFTRSLPSSLTFLNPITAGGTMAGMVGQEIDDAGGINQATEKDVLVGGIKAGLEVASERMFGAGKAARELVGQFGKGAAEKMVKEAATEMTKRALIKKVGRTVAEETIGEAANQIGSNAADIYINNKDIPLTQGVGDAALMGLFGGITQGGGANVATHYLNKSALKTANEKRAKAETLKQEAANVQNEIVRETLNNESKKQADEADAIIDKENELGATADPVKVAEIEDVNNEIDAIEAELPNVGEEGAKVLNEKLAELQGRYDVLIEDIKAPKIPIEEQPKSQVIEFSGEEVKPKSGTPETLVEPNRQQTVTNENINEPTNPTIEGGTTSTDSNLPENPKVEQVQADSKKAETDSERQVEEQVDSKGVPETQDSGTQKVDISTLNKGDEFYSDGEKYKFISKEEDGRVTVRTKSGTLRTTDIESFKDATKDSSKSGTPKTEENANNKSNSETKTLKGNEGENIADKESQNDKAGEGDGGVNESDIVKDPVLKRLNKGFLKIGTTILDNAKSLKDKAKELSKGGKEIKYNIGGKEVAVKPVSQDVVNGFYSPLEKVITDSKFDKLPAKQWAEKYANSEEAKWTGLTDWLAQQQGSVSKSDIQQYLKDNRIEVVEVVKGNTPQPISFEAYENYPNTYLVTFDNGEQVDVDFSGSSNSGRRGDEFAIFQQAKKELESNDNDTKFSQYQLEGEKENYKEVLVTFPQSKQQKEINRLADKYGVENTYISLRTSNATDSELEFVRSLKNDQFKSSHFDEPNILVHLRMNTRTDAEGNKVLFLEEVQSDWGQKGKKEGFKENIKEGELPSYAKIEKVKVGDTDLWKVYDKNGHNIVSSLTKEDAIRRANTIFRNSTDLNTPTAPFVTDTNSWTKLGLKVALKEAVKQGADKIAWTTGEQQNERYDLSKQVDVVDAKRNKDGSYEVEATKDGSKIFGKSDMSLREIEDTFGKDVAQKINDSKSPLINISGDNLKAGGKGMKGFYGSPTEGSLGIVGNVAKSLFKQEPKTVEIESGRKDYLYTIINKTTGNSVGGGFTLKKANDFIESREAGNYEMVLESAPTSTQHSIDITPELKASVEGGQPLFHYGKDGEILGFTHDGKIYLNGEKITANTTMEEAGHIWINWAKENRSDLHKAGLDKVGGSRYLTEVEANKDYQKEALKQGKKGSDAYNNYMREEALAKAIADNGAKFITEAKKQGFKAWVTEMWKAVAKEFGIKNLSASDIGKLSLEEFSKKAAADVFSKESDIGVPENQGDLFKDSSKSGTPLSEKNTDKTKEKTKIKFERNTEKIKSIDEQLAALGKQSRKNTNFGANLLEAVEAVKLIIQKGIYKTEDIAKSLAEFGLNDAIPFIQDAINHILKNEDMTDEVRGALEGGDMELKSMLNRAHQSKESMNNEELRTAVENHGLKYAVEHWSEAEAKADALIADIGLENAYKALDSGIFPPDSAASIYVYSKYVDKLTQDAYNAPNEAEKSFLYNKAANVWDKLDTNVRGDGRRISALRDIYRNSDIGYSLASLRTKLKQAMNGEEPTLANKMKFDELAKEFDNIKQQEAAHAKKIEELQAALDFERIRKGVEGETNAKKARDKATIKKDLDAARIQFRRDMGQLSSGGLQALSSFTKLVKLSIEYGIKTAEDFYKEFKDDFKGHSEQEVKDAFDNLAKESLDSGTPKEFAKIDKDGKLKLSDSLINEIIKQGIDDGSIITKKNKTEITPEESAENVKYLLDKVYEKLTPEQQDKFNRRQVQDAISNYGKQRFPSKDEVKQKRAELNRDLQLASGEEDLIKGKRPSKTGYQREKPTDSQRAAKKRVNDLLKNFPEDAADVEKKFATANDRITSFLENKKKDLLNQIDKGVRTIRDKNSIEYTEKNKLLKAEVEELQKILDQKVGKDIPTHEELVNKRIQQIETLEEKYQKKIDKKDFTPAPKNELVDPRLEESKKKLESKKKEYEALKEASKEKKSELEKLVNKASDFTSEIEKEKTKETPSQSELDRLRKEKDLTDGQISNLVNDILSNKTDGEKKITSLEKQLADIKKGAIKDGKPREYTTDEKTKIDDLNKQINDEKIERGLKLAPKSQELARKIKSKQDAIAKLKDKLSKNDLSSNGKKIGITNAELDKLQTEHESLLKDLAARRKALTYRTPEEIATENSIKSLQRTHDRLVAEIAKNDLAYKERTQKAIATTSRTALRESVNALRDLKQKMREESGVADLHKLKLWKIRAKAQIAKWNEQLRTNTVGDIKPKKELELDEEGKLIQHEKERVKYEIDTELEKIRLLNRTDGEVFKDVLINILSSFKGFASTGDLSAGGRQGVILGVRNPKVWMQSFMEQFKHAKSQQYSDKYLADLHASDIYPIMKRHGLFLNEKTHTLAARDEMWASDIPGKVPVYGVAARASERAYNGMLNTMRVKFFTDFYEGLQRDGITGKDMDKELDAYAEFINNATGRGKLPKKYEALGTVLNGIYFSPKFVASRFKLLYDTATLGKSMKETPKARKEAVRTMVSFLTVTLGIAALVKMKEDDKDPEGWKVELDTRSSDAFKLRHNNDRIDLFAGHQQVAVLLARAIATAAQIGNVFTGHHFDDIATVKNQNVKIGGDYYEGEKKLLWGEGSKGSMGQVLSNFSESKIAPLTDLGEQVLLTGKNKRDNKLLGLENIFDLGKKGETVNPIGLSIAKLPPMWTNDLIDIYQENPALLSSALTAMNITGFGVQHQEEQNQYMKPTPKVSSFLKENNIKVDKFTATKADNGDKGTTVKGVFVKLTPEQVKKVDELTEKYTMEEIELRMKNADIPLEINEQGLEIPSSELKPRLNSQNIDIKKEIGEIKTRAKERAIMNLGYLKPDDIIDKSIEKQIKKIDELD